MSLNFAQIKKSISQIFYDIENKDWILINFWNSLYLAFFLLPLGINLPTPFFVIAIILGITQVIKAKKNYLLQHKAVLLFPIYFSILALSLTYTENFNDGLEILQRSLSLLFFPVIFLFVKEDALKVRKLFKFLLIGIITSLFYNFCVSSLEIFEFIIEQNYSWTKSFVLHNLREIMNYFGGLNFAILIDSNYISLYILLILSYFSDKKIVKTYHFSIVFFLFAYLYLLASRAAFLIVIVLSIYSIFTIKDQNKRFLLTVIFILGCIVFTMNTKMFPEFSNKNVPSTIKTSLHSRLLTWKASFSAIKEEPFIGYGLGDAKPTLLRKYQELGYQQNFLKAYNSHNQFLETWLQTGIVGLSVLLSIFVLLGYKLRRNKNEMMVLLILFISLFFESMLVRFNGIVFFSIIIPLLMKERSILSAKIIRNY